MTIIIIGLGALFLFYRLGGFGCLIRAAEMATGEAEPVRVCEPQQAETKPQSIDRAKLEQIAANCLAATNCSFDTYYYIKSKNDIELMDIIKDFNLKYIYE